MMYIPDMMVEAPIPAQHQGKSQSEALSAEFEMLMLLQAVREREREREREAPLHLIATNSGLHTVVGTTMVALGAARSVAALSCLSERPEPQPLSFSSRSCSRSDT